MDPEEFMKKINEHAGPVTKPEEEEFPKHSTPEIQKLRDGIKGIRKLERFDGFKNLNYTTTLLLALAAKSKSFLLITLVCT